MSISQQQDPIRVEADTSPVIENELPAYRAVSPGAVVALILGVGSVLSFTSYWFLALAALAALIGFLADRKIQRMPDVLTGRGIAQAGIGLALVFGLTAVSTSTAQYYIRATNAKVFAEQYRKVLKEGSLADAIFYFQHPKARQTTTPEQNMESIQKSAPEGRVMETQFAGVRELKNRVAEEGGDIHFETIENVSDDGASTYAAALYEVHAPNAKAPAPKEGFALAILKGAKHKGQYQWWVDDVRYPYQPASFVAPAAKAADDGHGHAH